MAIVNFTLSEEGVVVLQTALACMLKFVDEVYLEAFKDKVCGSPTPCLLFPEECQKSIALTVCHSWS